MYEGNSSCTWAGEEWNFLSERRHAFHRSCLSERVSERARVQQVNIELTIWFAWCDSSLKATREQQHRLNWPASTLVAKAIFSYEPSEPVAATDAGAHFYIKDSTGHLSHKRKLFND